MSSTKIIIGLSSWPVEKKSDSMGIYYHLYLRFSIILDTYKRLLKSKKDIYVAKQLIYAIKAQYTNDAFGKFIVIKRLYWSILMFQLKF